MARSYKPPAIRWADRFNSAQRPAIKGPPSKPAPQSEQSPDEQERTARVERLLKQLAPEGLSKKARKKIAKQQRKQLQQERLRARLLSQRKSVELVAHERQETIKEYNRGARNAQRTVNSQRNSRPQDSSQAIAYRAIKESVKAVYLSLKTQDRIHPENVGLNPTNLAIAATSPASSDEERKQAIAVILEFPSATIASILRNVVEKAAPGSKRRLHAAETLLQMGEDEHLDRVRREKDPKLEAASLSWQVLPPGWWNDTKYTNRLTKPNGVSNLVIERLRFVDSLGPRSRYIGSPRFGNYAYWVFVFASHVVAECPLEGNAIYVINDTKDWRSLLGRSKRNLLTVAPDRVERIVHNGDWKTKLRVILQV